MVKGLEDKYSAYTPASEAEETLSGYSGVSKGIGVNIVEHPDNRTIYICQVFEDSPAKTVGLQIGDEIISVDGQSVADIGYSQAVNLIGEKKNGEVAASPFASESFGGYSYTKITSASGISWQSQFRARLNRWKKL